MKISVITMMALFVLSSFAHSTPSSFGTRGGGNANVAEFYNLGNKILSSLAPLKTVPINGSNINIKKLMTTFGRTKVIAVNRRLSLNGAIVEAINYPDVNLIEFRVDDWKSHNLELKSQLVIHEILGVSKVADPEFKVSRELLNIAVSNTDYDVTENSGDLCEGTRHFRGVKAKNLVSAMLHAGVQSSDDSSGESYRTDFECNIVQGPYGDGLTRGHCNTPENANDANAIEIVTTLWSLGIFADAGMGHTWAEAHNVTCTIKETKSGDNQYDCDVTGTWSFGCNPTSP